MQTAQVAMQHWLMAVVFLATVVPGYSLAAGPTVWAVGEGVRIDPITSRAFEEDVRVLPGGVRGDYRRRSLIWGARKRTISLKGAANGVPGFQLILEGADVRHIAVEAGPLKRPSGATIPAENATFFRAYDVYVGQWRVSWRLGAFSSPHGPAREELGR